MRILVVGATGRTGRHVVDRALARGQEVRDRGPMEAVLCATGIDWMILRPPRLLGGKSEGYRIAVDARSSGSASMQRSDLAAFLLDEAEARRHSQKVVGITAAK